MLLSLKGSFPPAILALADGTVFIGNSIGAVGTTVGEVVEEGSHDDLMARQGAYFRLYEAQARNVDADLDDKDD